MLSQWKKILLLAIVAGVLYGGCNNQSVLWAENVLRKENPGFTMTPGLCYFLGNLAYMTFRYQLAIDITERNLQDFPYNPNLENAQYRRAVCYEKLGQYDKAIKFYENFLLDHPKSNRYQSIENKLAKLRALYQQK
jgi:tetratricopeptide (TPR) repeat protein